MSSVQATSGAAPLHLLCAGAAQGLVNALQQRFESASGASLQARFGAVGAMKELLLAGAPCDVFVASTAMVEQLSADGLLRAGSGASLGKVPTGIAMPVGATRPDVATPAAVQAALLAASAIYFPDAERSTAGIHFAGVLRRLGVWDALQPRLRTFPNGATAMRALADAGDTAALGCTQATEINDTDGVVLIGMLPPPFELLTDYAAAVSSGAADAAQAAAFVALLAGDDARAVRHAGGFVG